MDADRVRIGRRTGSIASHWTSYAAEVVPSDASAVQIQETRRAFYAGARAGMEMLAIDLFDNAVETPSCGHLPEGGWCWDCLHAELEAFVAEVAAGRA